MNTKSNAKDRSPGQTLELIWNGRTWEVDCNIPAVRLRSGAPFTVEIPEDIVLPPDRLCLFEAGTTLYLRFEPSDKNKALETKLKDYFEKIKREHKDSKGLLLYPIMLKANLIIQRTKRATRMLAEAMPSVDGFEASENWRALPCISYLPVEDEGEQEFPSLNGAVKHAMKKYTNSAGGYVDCYDRVYYEHFGYRSIDEKRRLLVGEKKTFKSKLKQPRLF